MAKASKTKQADMARGRILGLGSLGLALLFLISVAQTVDTAAHEQIIDAPNLFVLTFALISAGISWKWDRRIRLLVALSLGIIFAASFIWLIGLQRYPIAIQ